MTVYECVLEYDSPSGEMLNVVHWDLTGTAPLNFQDFVDNLRTEFVNSLAAVIAPSVSFVAVTIREDSPGAIGIRYTPTAGSAAGTSTDNQYGPQLAALVRKRCENGQRPALGFAYQGGITSEGLTSAGRWSATVNNAVFAFWDANIIIPFAGDGQAEMVVKASNPTAPNTVAYNSVTSINVGGIPVTQKRRKEGVGS